MIVWNGTADETQLRVQVDPPTVVAARYSIRFVERRSVRGEVGLGEGQPAITVGRREDCDLRVEDPRVSRTHARIELDGESILLHDLSRNGVFVNEARAEEGRRLVPGDRITLGPPGLWASDTWIEIVAPEGKGRARHVVEAVSFSNPLPQRLSLADAEPDVDERAAADRVLAVGPVAEEVVMPTRMPSPTAVSPLPTGTAPVAGGVAPEVSMRPRTPCPIQVQRAVAVVLTLAYVTIGAVQLLIQIR